MPSTNTFILSLLYFYQLSCHSLSFQLDCVYGLDFIVQEMLCRSARVSDLGKKF